MTIIPGSHEVISPWSFGGPFSAVATGAAASATWPSANLAIFVPVRIMRALIIAQIAIFNGSAVSGNVDVGLYDAAGTRLVSSGSTAQSGTLTLQVINVTDTLVDPGVYYLALAIDNTTGTQIRAAPGAEILRGFGFAQQASAFPLPAVATFAALAQSYLVHIEATPRTVL